MSWRQAATRAAVLLVLVLVLVVRIMEIIGITRAILLARARRKPADFPRREGGGRALSLEVLECEIILIIALELTLCLGLWLGLGLVAIYLGLVGRLANWGVKSLV